MTTESDLFARSGAACELCAATDGLAVYEVPPASDGAADRCVLLCAACRAQVDGAQAMDSDHWRCLADSMWTPVPAVQAVAWRMLTRLDGEAWAVDLLDQLYLDDETLAWARSGLADAAGDGAAEHRDCHGAALAAGDTVTLIKDLNVKGASFTAKRGTAVRGISLVPDNAKQIEGRVNGQLIVILTEFVKKSG
ncbi:MAG: PhnA protein [Rhodospirillales bacterium CG15_BIG_FIL_POST_REV_8_21_14_020_66_15]|nr:MAG: PhnA protein [Rhodospirillales bacterium CG15_BIG_FIL_POST_REV_8_21_14_020_66_15]